MYFDFLLKKDFFPCPVREKILLSKKRLSVKKMKLIQTSLLIFLLTLPSAFPATINMPIRTFKEGQPVKFSLDDCLDAWCRFSGEQEIIFKSRCGLQNSKKLLPGRYTLEVISPEGADQVNLTVFPKPVYVSRTVISKEFGLKLFLGITIFLCILLLWKTL